MQLARLAVKTGTVVVINPICSIRILLDFRNNDSGAERVNRACGNVECVACGDRDFLHAVHNRAVLQRGPQAFAGDVFFQAADDFSIRLSIQHVPHFCFA
ncbi:hypothetical protein D3C86_1931440 [compost metagenome]